MKNLKYIAILLIQLALLQFSFAQGIDENGRPKGTAPGTVVEETTQPQAPVLKGDDDRDIPGETREAPMDYFYPSDLDLINDELINSANPVEIIDRINELAESIDALRLANEELRLENKIIRESLANCCNDGSMGLSAKDAYLLQNAPNPFNQSSEIRYFIPGGLDNVEIRVCDIKGEVLKSFNIKAGGYGKVQFDAGTLTSNTYVYMLTVNGEIVDSKVMMVTR